MNSVYPLPFVDYLCVVMLQFVRKNLLAGDHSACIRRLLSYPPVEDISVLISRYSTTGQNSTLFWAGHLLELNIIRKVQEWAHLLLYLSLPNQKLARCQGNLNTFQQSLALERKARFHSYRKLEMIQHRIMNYLEASSRAWFQSCNVRFGRG